MELIRMTPETASILLEAIRALGEYHNQVAKELGGIYPLRPPERTVQQFADEIRMGTAMIEALMDGDEVIGFSGVTVEGSIGSIKYLFVQEAHRGKGYGAILMESALGYLNEMDWSLLDVEVVHGNPAIRFYEKYGFQIRSYLLGKKQLSL